MKRIRTICPQGKRMFVPAYQREGPAWAQVVKTAKELENLTLEEIAQKGPSLLEEDCESYDEAALRIRSIIEEERRQNRKVVLLGYSQGAAVVYNYLKLGLDTTDVLAFVAIAGWVPCAHQAPKDSPPDKLTITKNAISIHGQDDTVVPLMLNELSVKASCLANVGIEQTILKASHEITPEMIKEAASFIKKRVIDSGNIEISTA